MRCAVIDRSNTVINIIVADPEKDAPPGDTRLVPTDTAGPGWVWDGEVFTDPTPPAVTEPPTPPVPIFITRRQCALELYARQIITLEEALAMTKTAEVPVAIAQVFDAAVTNGQMTADQRMLAEIDFAAINYYRANSLLGFMGLTDLQIDEFFVAAAQR